MNVYSTHFKGNNIKRVYSNKRGNYNKRVERIFFNPGIFSTNAFDEFKRVLMLSGKIRGMLI